jgi:hypothetical protein
MLESMARVVLIVADRRCELESADARVLATTLLSRPATARVSVGLLLRSLARGRRNGPLAIQREEHENGLRLALAELDRAGHCGRSLRGLRQALDSPLVTI